jgi:diazepam-binding inhibitor (GABA receptor modulator, acyl-CoA-binding protein)
MSFEKAVADSKKLTSKPSNEELLDLYGTPGQARPAAPNDGHPTDSAAALFKIANGEDISAAPTPGMFDLKVRLP